VSSATQSVRPQVYRIVSDGGTGPTRTDHGYGSYLLECTAEDWRKTVRLDFGEGVTCNVAEYKALIAALEDLITTIRRAGRQPGDCTVTVWCDSRLVIGQVLGDWRIHADHLRPLRQHAWQLLKSFREAWLKWVSRDYIVTVLGH